jgi:hypothetical protein
VLLLIAMYVLGLGPSLSPSVLLYSTLRAKRTTFAELDEALDDEEDDDDDEDDEDDTNARTASNTVTTPTDILDV